MNRNLIFETLTFLLVSFGVYLIGFFVTFNSLWMLDNMMGRIIFTFFESILFVTWVKQLNT